MDRGKLDLLKSKRLKTIASIGEIPHSGHGPRALPTKAVRGIWKDKDEMNEFLKEHGYFATGPTGDTYKVWTIN